MENRNSEEESHQAISKNYFAYMGGHFPQQCASDEFYFFPRSETAIQHLDALDDLVKYLAGCRLGRLVTHEWMRQRGYRLTNAG